MTAWSFLQSGTKQGPHAERASLHSCHNFERVNYSLCPSVVEMSQECTASDRQTPHPGLPMAAPRLDLYFMYTIIMMYAFTPENICEKYSMTII